MLNIMKTLIQFAYDDLSMSEKSFVDCKSKYLDLYDRVKRDHQKEKVPILNDLDHELELIHRDEIIVTYILKLPARLKDVPRMK